MNELEFIKEVLRLFDDDGADKDALSWFFEEGRVHFTVWMNDFFGYALSYCVYIEPEDIELLKKSIEDCRAAMEYGSVYAHYVFVCRKENLRPISPYYNDEKYKLPKSILDIIDNSVK